jgi:hypothetical protein
MAKPPESKSEGFLFRDLGSNIKAFSPVANDTLISVVFRKAFYMFKRDFYPSFPQALLENPA